MDLIQLTVSQLKLYHVSFREEARMGFLDEAFLILELQSHFLK